MNPDYVTHRTSSPFVVDTRFFYLCVGQENSSSNTVVFFQKGLDLKIKAVFRDPEGKLVILDVNNSDGGAFRLSMLQQRQGGLITSSVWMFSWEYFEL